MKNNIEKQKGITLISLSVTIIVLIILAGISINAIVGENGIIQRAKEQIEEQKKAQILEQLELAKGPLMVENKGYTDLTEYLNAIEGKKFLDTYEVTSIERTDEANAIIWVDGKYKYKAAQVGVDVIINEIGYVGKLPPEIKSFYVTSSTSHSINVEVSASMAEEYEFYIGENENEYKLIETIKKEEKETNEIETINYLYENLTTSETGKTYYIKVIVKNKNGMDEEIIENNTNVIPTPTITVENSDTWSSSKNITISTEGDYIVKYTTDGTIPSANNGIIYTGPFTINDNCTITAVYLDSTNQIGSGATNTITKIDKVKPVITDITTNSNTILLKATDELSGITGYAYSKENKEPSSFIEIASTQSLEKEITGLDWNTTYYVWVKDAAGNISEVKSVQILARHTVTVIKGTGIASVTGAGTYTVGQTVTVTATVLDGYTWSKWTGTNETTSQTYTFSMPDNDVTLTANAISDYVNYALQYRTYDFCFIDGDGKTATMTMQYVNISAGNAKYLKSITTSGSQSGTGAVSNLLSQTFTDVQNVGKSLTATKSGLTEHNDRSFSMAENVTLNLSYPRKEVSEYSIQFSISGSYRETGGSTQAQSHWHGMNGAGCNVFTIPKEQLAQISRIYVDGVQQSFSTSSDFVIYKPGLRDKRGPGLSFSHTIQIVFK